MDDNEQCLINHQCSYMLSGYVHTRNGRWPECRYVSGVLTDIKSSVLLVVKLPSLKWVHSDLFVIPLEHDELVLQALILTLQIHSGQVHLIQHPLQSSNVRLHSHPHGQLVLIPERTNRSGRFLVGC